MIQQPEENHGKWSTFFYCTYRRTKQEHLIAKLTKSTVRSFLRMLQPATRIGLRDGQKHKAFSFLFLCLFTRRWKKVEMSRINVECHYFFIFLKIKRFLPGWKLAASGNVFFFFYKCRQVPQFQLVFSFQTFLSFKNVLRISGDLAMLQPLNG